MRATEPHHASLWLQEQDGTGEPGEQHAASSHGHIGHGLGRLSGIGAALPQSPSPGPGQGVGRGQAQGTWGPLKLPPQQQPDQGQGRKTLGDPSPWDDLAQSLPLQLRSLQEGPAGEEQSTDRTSSLTSTGVPVPCGLTWVAPERGAWPARLLKFICLTPPHVPAMLHVVP